MQWETVGTSLNKSEQSNVQSITKLIYLLGIGTTTAAPAVNQFF